LYKSRVNDINQIRLPDDFDKEDSLSGNMSTTAETIDNFDSNVETILDPFELLNVEAQADDHADDL